MNNIAYKCGTYDILRAKDLGSIDRMIQMGIDKGSHVFAIGVYTENLCDTLGITQPLKSLEDRMSIMEQITGVDFVFPVDSLDVNIIKKRLKEGYNSYLKKLEEKKETETKNEKKYEVGYAPGTYDLFHAGHLENLMIASEQCEKLIVGIKSNELVMEHKHKEPIISDDERIEIIRHFKFVYDVYKYHTRDLHAARSWIKFKYGKDIEAVFLGSDLKNDFKDVKDMNIIYTPRDKELMKTRSTSAYRTLKVKREEEQHRYANRGKPYKMSIKSMRSISKKRNKNNFFGLDDRGRD